MLIKAILGLLIIIINSQFSSHAIVKIGSTNQIITDEYFAQEIIKKLRKKRAFVNLSFGQSDYNLILEAKNINSAIRHLKIDGYELFIHEINKKNKVFHGSIQSETEKIKFNFRGRYEEFILIPTMKFSIKQGQTIFKQDVEMSKINVDRVKKNTIMNEENLIGATAKHNLMKNMPIKENDITGEILVKKKDTVTIFYDDGGLSLKSLGIALENGVKGDQIKVKNPQTNNVIKGVVEGVDTVRVKP